MSPLPTSNLKLSSKAISRPDTLTTPYFPEESGETDGSAGYRWVIDPIDGTTNFFAGIPFWAISIGVEHNGQTEIGVVYLPATGELFHAIRGQGAFLNDIPIHTSPESHLSRCVISTGFPVDKDTNPDNNLDNLAVIMPLVRDIRRPRIGSVRYLLCSRRLS